MKAPDAVLVRARAKAPLADLQALHLSSADLANLRHLEACRRLRSLYANANVLKDIEGLLCLRCLWRIDLSDNLIRQLKPLASFPALGFLHLERNQLTFDDLVWLRDVHILDLRLGGNPALQSTTAKDHLATIEYRMKVIALVPYAWTLDGHYVTTHERAQALEMCDDWVVHMLARHSEGADPGTLRFGSTSDLWGGMGEDDVVSTSVQEEALKLLDAITKQPTRNPDQQDLFRLRTITGFHDNESSVHNAHIQFAPQKHSANAKSMPAIRRTQVQTLPRRVRLEISVLLAAHLDFPLPTKLITDALTIAMLSEEHTETTSTTWVHDLASLPPYATVALLSVLRQQALEEHDKSRSCGSSLASSELWLWKAMPAVIPTLLQSERRSRFDHSDTPDQVFLQRCAFAVSLLSRAASFPPKPSPSNHGDLVQLIEAAKLASTASLESLEFAIPSVLVGDSSSSDMPWKKKKHNLKNPDREYRKPWSERPDIASVEEAPHCLAPSGVEPTHGKSAKRRRPKPGEWLEVSTKCFFKIRSVSADGSALSASPATDTRGAPSALITLRIDQIARVSSSMWRLTNDEPHTDEILQLISKIPLSTTKNRLGKLHRDSHGFHKHGASHNQGYPNRDVSADDLHGVSIGDELLPTRQPQPVEVFSATDTLDANYVLTSPALIAVQNTVAVRSFHEQRRAPAGLWNPIEIASFQITPVMDGMETPTKSLKKTKKPPTLKRNASLPASPQSEDDWLELQREMQALLGIRPRTPLTPPGSTDVTCFLTAVPGTNDGDFTLCDSLSACSSPAATALASAPPTDDPSAMASRSTAKPRKLESLAWHQVATKPQLLVAAASPVPLQLPPRHHSHGTNTLAGRGGADASLYPLDEIEDRGGALDAASLATGSRPPSGGARATLRLTRCHVSLPTLSLVSQK